MAAHALAENSDALSLVSMRGAGASELLHNPRGGAEWNQRFARFVRRLLL